MATLVEYAVKCAPYGTLLIVGDDNDRYEVFHVDKFWHSRIYEIYLITLLVLLDFDFLTRSVRLMLMFVIDE